MYCNTVHSVLWSFAPRATGACTGDINRLTLEDYH